ncbi:MAG: hypothetical protein ACJ8C4_20160 [Gemmataceae bacterium]
MIQLSQSILGNGLPALLLLAAFAAAGCGPAAPPPLAPVRGKATYNGQPLAKVRIEFIPEEETGAKVLRSTAVTNADGTFEMMCENGKPGATVGWHRVVVRPISRSRDPNANPFEPEVAGQRNTTPPIEMNLGAYTSVATTPERQEIKLGDNEVKLELH